MRSWVLWLLAFGITLASAVYQRLTGPTHPVRGSAEVAGSPVSYRLPRSHGGGGDAPVRVTAGAGVRGELAWKRYKTDDPWTTAPMERKGEALEAGLPHQPPAGKVMYRVTLRNGADSHVANGGESIVLRFRGGVPAPVLILHVIAMFGAMLVSTRAGLEPLSHTPRYGRLIAWTLFMLFAGGLTLGPVVQKYAFGAYWTGWPFGTDLTDNKTAAAFVAWLAAAWAYRRSKRPGAWAAGAAAVTLAIFLIPHSLLGSELDYNAAARQRTPVNNGRAR